jgi:glycosyltransferase involved in cell wall biosynthesis
VKGPFLFYPAHSWPHKNHARLLQAVDAIADELPNAMRVILTGDPLAADHPAAVLLRERPRLAARVVHLGYRSPLEVRALFQECTALAFPSLFEGFGMPVAEAIIAGKPVACSNAASLPEICGDAAVTFDPDDVDEMAARLLEVATTPALRASLAEAARRRRAVFSATDSAIKTLAVYEDVFARVSGATP